MILISASRSILEAYKIKPANTTPVIMSGDWYRMWRVDARLIGREDITFFTNIDTCYTIIIDSKKVRYYQDLFERFMVRYVQLFRGRFGYFGNVEETIVVHKAVDRSIIGVMNNFFQMAEIYREGGGYKDLESRINDILVVAKNLIQAASLAIRLNAAGSES